MSHKSLHELTVDEFVDGITGGSRHLLSRAITLVESNRHDHEAKAHAILDRCLTFGRRAIRIGITGSPGAGKSTFIESFGLELVNRGLKVAVLAIDPSSTRSGGSILGDKARMEKLSLRPEVFIRPTASSGYLGGTSPRTHETILLCEAAGHDVIIVETVGVGQSEIVVNSMVDFILLLMLPGSGDELQGIKRGIMEIADSVAITKADGERSGIARVSKSDFEAALRLLPEKHTGWERKVLLTSSVEGTGIAEAWQIILDFVDRMTASGQLDILRREQLRLLLYTIVEDRLKREFFSRPSVTAARNGIEQQVLSGAITPFSGAIALLEASRTS
ncbi:MAG: methylmalonyl Co-A mutase-associated GTPase MeaB [Chlorobiaceae bacterium]|nr:methylmalonyl Co-A mutase-associated GTPase MeaB [Chlorobiaceae bacterium]NTW74308.1 methylmalonyl Co-A mutase-associated GTPase MeaB [Chlorobiaceae bacterium]